MAKKLVDKLIKWTAIADIIVLILLILSLFCLNKCTRDIDIRDGFIDSVESSEDESDNAVSEANKIGNTGDLKITLLWNFQGDIDLHVIEPNGVELFYASKRDPYTGGFLDVDNRIGGMNSAENIYWENPPKGRYKVFLVYFQPSEINNIAEQGNCTVVIQQKGKPAKSYTVAMSHVNEKRNVTTIEVD